MTGARKTGRWLSFFREEEGDNLLVRKKNEEVKEDTSRRAGRWGTLWKFSPSQRDRYARLAYFLDQTLIGHILSSRQ